MSCCRSAITNRALKTDRTRNTDVCLSLPGSNPSTFALSTRTCLCRYRSRGAFRARRYAVDGGRCRHGVFNASRFHGFGSWFNSRKEQLQRRHQKRSRFCARSRRFLGDRICPHVWVQYRGPIGKPNHHRAHAGRPN